ncbi:MAG: DUF5808 domain-containing protein [Acidobacteriota bacterium]
MNLGITAVKFLCIFQVLFVAGVFYFAPRWTRRGLFFTVTVDPDFATSERAGWVLSRYRRRIIGVAVGCLAVILWASLLSNLLLASLVSGVQVLLCFGCLLAGRRQILPYSRQQPDLTREASLVTQPDPLPGGFLGQAGPFLVLFAAGLFLISVWDSIPETFATHWGPDGQPDAWTHKNRFSVTMPLAFGAGLSVLIQWLAYSLLTHARRVDSAGEGAVTETARRTALARATLIASYFTAGLMGWISLSPILEPRMGSESLGMVTLVATTLGSVALMIYVLAVLVPQFKVANRQAESPGDRSPDACWKLGVLYFAPDDPAIWVEKRFGLGYTLNFAQPIAWATIGIAVLGPALILTVWTAGA